MWVVAKIKKNESNIFMGELIKEFDSEIKFYNPKIQYQKYIKNKIKKIEKSILENYIFCYHATLDQRKVMRKARFFKGLDYFLQGNFQDQNEIIRFIDHCKSYENKDGYLTEGFFKTMISGKAQFLSGPFTNMIFEILQKQKNKLKILIGNFVTTVQDNRNYLYRPVL